MTNAETSNLQLLLLPASTLSHCAACAARWEHPASAGRRLQYDSGFTGCGKTLYGREDVSGHEFIRATKLLKMNNTDLPKACAERTE